MQNVRPNKVSINRHTLTVTSQNPFVDIEAVVDEEDDSDVIEDEEAEGM